MKVKKWGLQQLVALVISILLWAFVRYNQRGVAGTQTMAQLTLDVRIDVKNHAPNLEPYDISQEFVRATLQGDATAVGALRQNMVTAYVDLKDMDGNNLYAPVKVLAPGGLTTIAQDPVQVNVKLSPPGESRAFTPRVIVSGSPANGLLPGQVHLEPKTVRLAGPAALLDDVHEVISHIVLDGQSQDYSIDLHDLTPVNSQGMEVTAKVGKGLKILPATVSATIPILSENRTVAVAVSLDQLRIVPAHGWTYRLEVEPEFVTLRLGRTQKAPKFLLTKPQSIAVSSKVDSRELDLIIPDGVEVVGSSTVTLKVVPEKADVIDSGTPDPTTSLIPDSSPSGSATPVNASKRDG